MTATDQLRNLATNQTGFAFDATSGASYQISDLGIEIIEWIKEGLPVEDINQRIVDDYQVDPHTAERDLTVFIANLRSLGLVLG